MKRLAPLLLATIAVAQTDVARYLEQNRQPLDVRQFAPTLLDLRDRQIILLGESHGVSINEEIDLAFLKYLHREAGVRVYLAEIGYSAGLMLNSYLETGSADILDFLMRQSQGSVAWTRERRDFWVKFREWNASLPTSDRVRIVGVDVEHQRGLAMRCLSGLARAATGQPPAAIAATAAKVPQTADPSFAAGELAASFKANRADYERWLGDRFFDFELVLANMRKANDYYAERDSLAGHEIRERAIYDNFLKLYARMGGGRWYGRWGSFHVLQRPSDNRNRFADFLNRPDSPVAGKVLSILMIYRDSEALMVPGYKKIPAASNEAPVGAFYEASQAPVTLFSLSGAGSPFARSMPGYFGGKAPATESVQHILLVRNGAASRPFEEELPPVVTRSIPESGSRDVPLSLTEVRVTFSKEMRDRSWSWCSAGGFEPPPLKNVRYDSDRRTVVGTVKLEPGKKYAIWLNKAETECSSFRDAQGQSAVPYLLSFETAAK